VLASDLQRLSEAARPDHEARPELGPLPLPSASEYQPLFAKPIEPLIEPRVARSVFSRIAGVRLLRGPIDVRAIVAARARGRLVSKLPRQPLATLAAGLELLIDVSTAMDPFREDTVQLIRQLRGVIGSERLSVRQFERCPSFGIEDDALGPPVPFLLPRSGVPILAATDLGIVRTRESERRFLAGAWRDLGRRAFAQGTPLTILTPYPRDRFGDRSLTRNLRTVVWDRGTGVRDVPSPAFVRRLND
jgi:hypothetical protein